MFEQDRTIVDAISREPGGYSVDVLAVDPAELLRIRFAGDTPTIVLSGESAESRSAPGTIGSMPAQSAKGQGSLDEALHHAERMAAAAEVSWGTIEFNVQSGRVHTFKVTKTFQEQERPAPPAILDAPSDGVHTLPD